MKDNPSYKISEAEKKAGQRDRHNMIVRRVCVDMARRTRLEACPEDWLKYYMGQAFRLSWADSHKAMIHNAIASAESGSGMVVAAPRGDGKSAILRGVALYLLLTGRINFPLVAPWTARNATAHFKAWIKFISEKGSRLSEDYPEYLQPFEISTNTAKLKHLKWEDTGELIGAEVSAADKQIILPDSLGAIMTASVNGDIKGTQVTLKSGEIIRPDLLMLDDAQDAKRADNPEAVQDMIDVIESEWFCLAGPDTSLTVFNACTVKHKNDVSEYFLRHPDFKAVRIARVITWPEGWEDDKSESWQHWHEWNNIRTSQGRNERNAYYLEHKDVMIKGFTVSWSDRFDKKKQEIDAYQSAMIAYFRFGKKAFFSEYQNDPIVDGIDVYTITPDIITSRTVDRDPFTLPEWSEVVVSATDINPSYALSSATYAFGKDRTAACLWYGLFEDAPLPTRMDMSETQKEQIIYGALKIHGEQMLKQRHGKVWAIDGGGAQSTVAKRFMYEWNRAHPEMQAVVCYGRSGKSARISARNETIRRRATDGSWILCRDKDPVYGWTEWVLWNSDHWREIMQRAWTCETGAPGGATLPRGHHREYAEHICRDKLKGKIELNGKMFFDYEKAPGRNDLGDATNMCWMLADLQGIGNGNGVVRQQQSRPQRRIRHVAI